VKAIGEIINSVELAYHGSPTTFQQVDQWASVEQLLTALKRARGLHADGH
jgi:hypothetical protein